MNYLVKYTLVRNENLDRKTVEYIADYWHKEGHLNLHINGHYEIFKDYNAKLATMKGVRGDKEVARNWVMKKHGMKSTPYFYEIINKFISVETEQ